MTAKKSISLVSWPLALQKAYEAPTGPRDLCIRVEMPHGHPQGEEPEEIRVFADSLVPERVR